MRKSSVKSREIERFYTVDGMKSNLPYLILEFGQIGLANNVDSIRRRNIFCYMAAIKDLLRLAETGCNRFLQILIF